jgi:hypothetical protein
MCINRAKLLSRWRLQSCERRVNRAGCMVRAATCGAEELPTRCVSSGPNAWRGATFARTVSNATNLADGEHPRPESSTAGGSRERLDAMFYPSRLFRAADTTVHRTATPRDVPGSRLLPADRAATWQSGSPSGRWAYDQPVFLKEDDLGEGDQYLENHC